MHPAFRFGSAVLMPLRAAHDQFPGQGLSQSVTSIAEMSLKVPKFPLRKRPLLAERDRHLPNRIANLGKRARSVPIEDLTSRRSQRPIARGMAHKDPMVNVLSMLGPTEEFPTGWESN
jgi:hypothetical protein